MANVQDIKQKLVYVTADYTNTSDETLADVLFIGGLSRIYEEEGQMKMAFDWNYEEPQECDI